MYVRSSGERTRLACRIGRHLGLNTHVMLDGCRGIDLEPGDIGRALDEMKRAGAVLLKSSEL